MFENQTAPYDDVVAAILRLWIVDQVSLACRGYGIVWARKCQFKKKKRKRFRWSPRPKQRATSKSTPSIHLQQQAPWLRESPLQKWHLITTFKHHSQEAELTPRSKSIRENSMPHVTVGAAKGNLEKRRSFNFAKWRSRHPMEMSSKSEWKKPELGKLDYLLYIIYIYYI